MTKRLMIFVTASVLAFTAGAQAQNNKPQQAAAPSTAVAPAPPNSAPAVTVQWTGKLSLNTTESDRHVCLGTTPVTYTFVLTNDQLMINTGSTKTIATVRQDGSVDHTFWTNKGNNPRVHGNVRTKSMKVVLYNGKCVWDALPS